MAHIPVLKKEVLFYLNPKRNENFIDCTFGEGGHSLSILEKNKPEGKVLGIDRTSKMIEKFGEKERLILKKGKFSKVEEIARENNFSADGILFDFGMSSWHIEESKRGFSFKENEPLDMRYDLSEELTAKDILNEKSFEEIKSILRDYGEERFASRIASGIVKEEKIETTFDLVKIIKDSTPGWYHHRKIHFATKTFQALRIAVNKELEEIEKGLSGSLNILKKDSRIVAISFHSLEDRIVKNFLRDNFKKGKLKILTKKPVTASLEEIKENRRSRSAKLRAAVIN
jgi:16S rRNA (cytosine1402-N4)-methyltransferase